MNALTLYGIVAVAAMLVFYAVEDRSPAFVLAFAAACLAASLYGFLQGAWPFGVVELIWSGVAVRRWWRRRDPAYAVPMGGSSTESQSSPAPRTEEREPVGTHQLAGDDP